MVITESSTLSIFHLKLINQATIQRTFRLLSFSSFILQVCFYTIFYIQSFFDFYVTLKSIAMKHSIGNIVNN